MGLFPVPFLFPGHRMLSSVPTGAEVIFSGRMLVTFKDPGFVQGVGAVWFLFLYSLARMFCAMRLRPGSPPATVVTERRLCMDLHGAIRGRSTFAMSLGVQEISRRQKHNCQYVADHHHLPD